jgi:hypothetical protein
LRDADEEILLGWRLLNFNHKIFKALEKELLKAWIKKICKKSPIPNSPPYENVIIEKR